MIDQTSDQTHAATDEPGRDASWIARAASPAAVTLVAAAVSVFAGVSLTATAFGSVPVMSVPTAMFGTALALIFLPLAGLALLSRDRAAMQDVAAIEPVASDEQSEFDSDVAIAHERVHASSQTNATAEHPRRLIAASLFQQVSADLMRGPTLRRVAGRAYAERVVAHAPSGRRAVSAERQASPTTAVTAG